MIIREHERTGFVKREKFLRLTTISTRLQISCWQTACWDWKIKVVACRELWTFHSQDHSLPGAKVSDVELSLPGTFTPLELSLHGTLALWNFRSLGMFAPWNFSSHRRMQQGAIVPPKMYMYGTFIVTAKLARTVLSHLINRNNLMKLASYTWGANTLRSSALALCYSAAEYCAPVWSRFAHTSQVDV